MMYKRLLLPVGILLPLVVLLGACGPAVNQPPTQKTVTINPTFQSQLSPVPTIPTYRCGSCTSNNAPGRNSTITIYARFTKEVAGVRGAMGTAVVNINDEDSTLDRHRTIDTGSYVSLPLAPSR